MSLFKKLKEKAKDVGQKVQDAAKIVGRAGAKAAYYGAPIVGTAVLGPGLGTAIGTGVSAVAGQVGPTKNKTAALKRAVSYGAAVGAVGGLVNVIGGQSITAPLTGLFTTNIANAGGGVQQTVGQTLPGGMPARAKVGATAGGALSAVPATNTKGTVGNTQGTLLESMATALLGGAAGGSAGGNSEGSIGPTGQNTGLPTGKGGFLAGLPSEGAKTEEAGLLSNPLVLVGLGIGAIYLLK